MLLDHLSIPLLASALLFGTSQAWPTVWLSEPGSIEDASHDNNNNNKLVLSNGLDSLRGPHHQARRRSVFETQTKPNLPQAPSLVRRTVDDDTPAPTSPNRRPGLAHVAKKRKLARRAMPRPFPGWFSMWKMQDGELYLSFEEDEKFKWEWAKCWTDRTRMFVR